MPRSTLVLLILLLCACDPASVVDDASTPDGSRPDGSSAGPDAGACAPGDHAGWDCVQGDPETHICTDSMFPPQCVEGRWDCQGGEPEWYVDCWCHVGPPPWAVVDTSLCACTEADGWTCQFHCGPTLLCTAFEEEYCERAPSDVGGEPDSYACRAPVCAGGGCDCVAEGSVSCATVENGGTVATYPGG